MDRTWQVLPARGKETGGTKPGRVTGTEPAASDKEDRGTLVTSGAGQATPRCQAATSIRRSGGHRVTLSRDAREVGGTRERVACT
ncbi:hypothetical protein EYF80_063362 [Liparis tanakae]|uniref:Uncharacterized protein n=1 Tax=Liparis tanakae TaxID=230148 RepID=A0A4Z2ECN2_9TELE|nr:hypothetical protein EYF80_063362 [Liparis tanakae]